eukprot:TRINITY_DN10726_c0_g1_i1.p1 TRINITY_DN10726_c0_g1~~TRINITY_DN10726_c0_g1_i1.p1  ORF type:complete len:722 (+),score=112.82 TRINITY_DN10726_c0_g1_i1:80-2245(+)
MEEVVSLGDSDSPSATTTTSAPPRSSLLEKFRYRPALDGVRGLAALLVVLYHADTPGFSRGYIGVDVFFVLSGFLIASLLLRELSSSHKIDLIKFYARRFRRLLPASALLLVVAGVAYTLAANPLVVLENRTSFFSAALYHANYYMVWSSQDYFASEDISPVQHFWSLSAEEQIYFFFPIFFWFLMWASSYDPKSKRLIALLGLSTVVGFVYTMITAQAAPMRAYIGTLERGYEICAGALIACITVTYPLSPSPSPSRTGDTVPPLASPYYMVGRLLRILSLCLFVALLIFELSLPPTTTCALACITTVMFLVGSEISGSAYIVPGFSKYPLVKLGALSYSLYLWHWPIIIVGDAMKWLPTDHPVRTLVVVLVSLVFAALSYFCIENPTRRLPINRPILLIAFSILISFSIAAGTWKGMEGNDYVQRLYKEKYTPLSALNGSPSSPSPSPISSSPPGDEPAPAPASPSTLVDRGPLSTSKNVLLIGDSMAYRYRDGLKKVMRSYGGTTTLLFQVGCSWFPPGDGIYWLKNLDKDYSPECAQQEEKIRSYIAKNKPAVVFIAGFLVNLALGPEKISFADPDRYFSIVKPKVEAALAQFSQHSNVMLLLPSRRPKANIMSCLAAAQKGTHDCDTPAIWEPGHEPLVELYEEVAAENSRVTTVITEDLFCPDLMCPAIYGPENAATWQDNAHFNPGYLVSLWKEFQTRIKAACSMLESPSFICE